jgi:hypothetical protein
MFLTFLCPGSVSIRRDYMVQQNSAVSGMIGHETTVVCLNVRSQSQRFRSESCDNIVPTPLTSVHTSVHSVASLAVTRFYRWS